MTLHELSYMVSRVASGRLPPGCSLHHSDGLFCRWAADGDHVEGRILSCRERATDGSPGVVLLRFKFPVFDTSPTHTAQAAIIAIDAAVQRWCEWEAGGARVPA
jgi:hypothetical protein